MSILLRRPLVAALVAAVLVLTLVAGVAWAEASESPESTFTGCLAFESAKITSVALGDGPAFPCTNSEQQVSWQGSAVIGIDGVAGIDGVPGIDGAAGSDGKDGQPGTQGPTGVAGPTGRVGPNGGAGPAGSTGPTGQTGTPGAAGEQGLAGPAGPTGQTGPPGPAGTTIFSVDNEAPPRDGFRAGDFYLDTVANVLFGPAVMNENGRPEWPAEGRAFAGAREELVGADVLTGFGPPDPLLGGIGDIYLDEDANILYGPRNEFEWGPGVSLTGGALLTGQGPPDAAVGEIGDLYIDLASAERFLYGPKSLEGWPPAPAPLAAPSVASQVRILTLPGRGRGGQELPPIFATDGSTHETPLCVAGEVAISGGFEATGPFRAVPESLVPNALNWTVKVHTLTPFPAEIRLYTVCAKMDLQPTPI